MSLHIVKDITEADFGCEEHSDGPHAVLVFEDGTRREVSEKWVKINEKLPDAVDWLPADLEVIHELNI